jgi:hypothetical protein
VAWDKEVQEKQKVFRAGNQFTLKHRIIYGFMR